MFCLVPATVHHEARSEVETSLERDKLSSITDTINIIKTASLSTFYTTHLLYSQVSSRQTQTYDLCRAGLDL